jgi:hypothetical protein
MSSFSADAAQPDGVRGAPMPPAPQQQGIHQGQDKTCMRQTHAGANEDSMVHMEAKTNMCYERQE